MFAIFLFTPYSTKFKIIIMSLGGGGGITHALYARSYHENKQIRSKLQYINCYYTKEDNKTLKRNPC